jgi:hypothetical protein
MRLWKGIKKVFAKSSDDNNNREETKPQIVNPEYEAARAQKQIIGALQKKKNRKQNHG